MSQKDHDKLAPPGAGIPAVERWTAGLVIKGLARYASKEAMTRAFTREAERAIAIARSISEQQGRRPVLIDRFPGIEDSSRNWSIYMALEHLVLVNRGITELVQRLCTGRQITQAVRIEAVKPRTDSGPEQAEELDNLVARYGEVIASHGDLRTSKRHPHPWFGPLSARQWHALAAIHNRIHRTQIEHILRRLR